MKKSRNELLWLFVTFLKVEQPSLDWIMCTRFYVDGNLDRKLERQFLKWVKHHA